MIQEFKVYAKYIKMNLLSGLEYKGWWLMVIQVLFVCVTDPLPTLLMFDRMGNIGAWTAERMLLIYALAVTSFGLAESFCRGFDYFPWRMIRSGNFDRLLLRPKTLFTQVAGSYFHLHRLARVTAGLFVIAWAMSRLDAGFSAMNILIVALTLIGGALTYSGVFVLSSGIAFFTVKALDWIYIITNASYQVTRIPNVYMPRVFKNIFTFILPVLLISYYPASVLCGWGEPVWTAFLSLPVGLLFLGVSILIWRFGVRHYKSTGS